MGATISIKRTTADLGQLGYANLQVTFGRRLEEVWKPLNFENDEAAFDLPSSLSSFAIKVQLQGDTAGSVKLEVKSPTKTLKPEFSRTIKPTEAGRPLVIYQGYEL